MCADKTCWSPPWPSGSGTLEPPAKQAFRLHRCCLLLHIVQHSLQPCHYDAKGGALQRVWREDGHQQLSKGGMAVGRDLRLKAAISHLHSEVEQDPMVGFARNRAYNVGPNQVPDI